MRPLYCTLRLYADLYGQDMLVQYSPASLPPAGILDLEQLPGRPAGTRARAYEWECFEASLPSLASLDLPQPQFGWTGGYAGSLTSSSGPAGLFGRDSSASATEYGEQMQQHSAYSGGQGKLRMFRLRQVL